jgi:hypothetical protein
MTLRWQWRCWIKEYQFEVARISQCKTFTTSLQQVCYTCVKNLIERLKHENQLRRQWPESFVLDDRQLESVLDSKSCLNRDLVQHLNIVDDGGKCIVFDFKGSLDSSHSRVGNPCFDSNL